MLALLFQPGLKKYSNYMDFSALLAGLENVARFENTGLGFLARAELRRGLNRSPCNRQFDFKRICFRGWAEISARLAVLKLQPRNLQPRNFEPLCTHVILYAIHSFRTLPL